MSKVELSDFINTLSPLFPNIKGDDLAEIYQAFYLLSESFKKENLTYIKRRDGLLKRTIFVFPRSKELYISLKRRDIETINHHLSDICRVSSLEEIFGFFSQIGFVTQKGRFNTCKPVICVNFKSNPIFSIRAKVTRLICREKNFASNICNTDQIDKEMAYRRQYNNHLNVPRLYHQAYYIGNSREETWIKSVEFSELLHRDLHSMLYQEPIHVSKDESYSILRQVSSILETLHEDNIVHGDVKPENIFINRYDNGDIVAKLGDFGHLSELQNLRTMNGTHNYWAPEQMKYSMTEESDDQNEIAFATDIWCLGWIIIHLFGLRIPEWYEKQKIYLELYRNKATKEMLKTAYDTYIAALKKHCNQPKPLRSDLPHYLLWQCWRIDPSERIQAQEIKRIAADPNGFIRA